MCKRRQIDMGIRHSHLDAGRPFKHPGRNLQPTVRIGTAQAAAKNSVTRPLDRRVNADSETKPRMPWVQQFSKLGSVGVLKLCCTTKCVRIRASIISPPNELGPQRHGPDLQPTREVISANRRPKTFGAISDRVVPVSCLPATNVCILPMH